MSLEKLRTDWRVDGDDVVLTIELRMASDWFFARAREIYRVFNPTNRPLAEQLLEQGRRDIQRSRALSGRPEEESSSPKI